MLEPRPVRDLMDFVLPEAGALQETGDSWEPYRLLDDTGQRVEPVALYFRDLLASSTSASTLRSYGHDLLRWWRFLWATETPWDRAVREDARDFMLWMRLASKPVRTHWRRRGKDSAGLPAPRQHQAGKLPAGSPNPVTGKPTIGTKYAASTRAHCETVLRTFYEFHLDLNSGSLLVNPFPLDRARRRGRAHAHHNPMDEFQAARAGRYRPKVPERAPRRIPDEKYTEVFAALRSDRDRALLAGWVSTGARASELLTAKERDALPGQQLVGVVRKGTQAYQQLPASPDMFVWLRLYQEEAWEKGVPRGRNQPLWWTLRRPWRPLNYHAARAMFVRVNEVLGANWTLHDLRHTAAYRMANDPEMQLTYVQHILAHRYLTTTQKYLTPSKDEVIQAGLAHHARRERRRTAAPVEVPAPGYDPESLRNLFGGPRA
ncbi:tyrosine-type recombinase/integrase [Streptomyces phaeochromogenes]|uniref:tyrosine-type recombinase/integrase n=1 Tax=Streptomyces phaeochromogenes TaxID=1923 RepID=UPI0006E2D70A|nr:site-specific integrase [Streptomyces phaeochromogenes]